jgi:epoxyqueuosine reductase
VCPWNQRAQRRLASNVRDFWAVFPRAEASFDDLLLPDEESFRSAFAGSAIRRVGWDAWRRNVAVALRDALDEDPTPALHRLADRAHRIGYAPAT